MRGMAEYWTPSEAAKELRVSVSTIYRLIEQRKISPLRVGGQWRLPVGETMRAATPTWPTFAEHCAPPGERRG